MIPHLLEPALAEEIASRIEIADFYRREHDGIGVEDCMEVNGTLAWLLLLVNDQRVLEVVRSITGCDPIGHFDGRVYRLEPSTEHYDSWHGDVGDGRLVAMSINLGRRAYEGGALEIRDRRTGETVRVRSDHVGDALLFEIGTHLEHRVLPVGGRTGRTVFAGWFKAGPNFLSVLRSELSADPTAMS
ncbi:MAG TPA: 2OG-Fe(II) oxygenase [Gaiellaceae bacterium]|nr:2OG-Fe(II) oxygenase [Gaiellaceae bacterium]